MLAKNSSDRNRFQDSEEYRTLIGEVSDLAKSVGIRFVPYPMDDTHHADCKDSKVNRHSVQG